MKRWISLVAVCVGGMLAGAADAAPPETLKLSDLPNRPDRWPAAVTINKDFNFSGGKSARSGQQVKILEFNGRELTVDAGGDLLFRLTPADCDLLDAANMAWAALTPPQRAVEPTTLLADPSLWPVQVTSSVPFRLNDGKTTAAGAVFDLVTIDRQGVQMYSAELQTILAAELAQTDVIAGARQRVLIDPKERPSRIVHALRKIMVDSEGKRHEIANLDQVSVFAFYYGASWCPPCRQFSPGLVKFVNSAASANPRLAVVMMSNDEQDQALFQYMKHEKMPWPAVTLAALQKAPIFISYAGSGIPQLVVVDRHGKVLASNYDRGQYMDPNQTVQALGKILQSGAAR